MEYPRRVQTYFGLKVLKPDHRSTLKMDFLGIGHSSLGSGAPSVGHLWGRTYCFRGMPRTRLAYRISWYAGMYVCTSLAYVRVTAYSEWCGPPQFSLAVYSVDDRPPPLLDLLVVMLAFFVF